MSLLPLIAAVLGVMLLAGCTTVTKTPLPTVSQVDLPRFMGDWYVIAHIPTFIEKQAYNAIERYDLRPDGTIATTFTFRQGGFDGQPRRHEPRGFVRDPVNKSTWGMQFVWPIKAEFLISHLDAGYTQTIIARNARDYAWIWPGRRPSRTPTMIATSANSPPGVTIRRNSARCPSGGEDWRKRKPQRRVGVAADPSSLPTRSVN